MRNKLAFLKDNGFPIISDSYDRDLRNSIAHMSFIVDEDGSLGYESKVKRKVNILTKEEVEDKMARLFIINQSINESIKQSKIYLT